MDLINTSDEKMKKMPKIVLISCLGLGLLTIVGIFFSLENKVWLDFWSDLALKLTYLYVVGAMLLIVSFALYHLIKHYQDNKGFLIGLGSITLLWGLSKVLATDGLIASPKLLDQLNAKYGTGVSAMVKNVDASLYLTYFLLILAIGAIIYNGIVGIFRK